MMIRKSLQPLAHGTPIARTGLKAEARSGDASAPVPRIWLPRRQSTGDSGPCESQGIDLDDMKLVTVCRSTREWRIG